MIEKKIINQEYIPYSHEFAFLSIILTYPNLIVKINNKIKYSDFLSKDNGIIYKIILDFFEAHNFVMPSTILQLLFQRENGNFLAQHFLNNIVRFPCEIENFNFVVERIINKKLLNKVEIFINKVNAMLLDAENLEEPKKLLDKTETLFTSLVKSYINPFDQISFLPDLFSTKLNDILNPTQKKIPLQFCDLYKLLGGLNDSEVTTIAARPSVGKTAFSLSLGLELAKQNFNVVFFSLEMSTNQILTRIISSITNIDSSKISNGELTLEEKKIILEFKEEFEKYKFSIVDLPSGNILDIKNTARMLNAKCKIDIVIIDYIQLINLDGRFESRNIEMGHITKEIKNLSKELSIPIIILSQLSRQVDMYNNKPNLSQIKSSGSIEEHFDNVAFLLKKDVQPNQGIRKIEFSLIKHRNGPIGHIDIDYFPHVSKFIATDVIVH